MKNIDSLIADLYLKRLEYSSKVHKIDSLARKMSSFSKFLFPRRLRLGVRICPPILKRRSTGALDGIPELYWRNSCLIMGYLFTHHSHWLESHKKQLSSVCTVLSTAAGSLKVKKSSIKSFATLPFFFSDTVNHKWFTFRILGTGDWATRRYTGQQGAASAKKSAAKKLFEQ